MKILIPVFIITPLPQALKTLRQLASPKNNDLGNIGHSRAEALGLGVGGKLKCKFKPAATAIEASGKLQGSGAWSFFNIFLIRIQTLHYPLSTGEVGSG